MSIHPRRLPHVRDQMVRLLSDPDSALRRHGSVESEDGFALDIAARHLTVGELYWVSSDMGALATSAGRALDTVSWTAADRPAGCGLMLIDGGVGWMPYQGADFPIEALSWGPGPEGLLLTLWVARDRLDAKLADRGGQVDPTEVPPLVPVLGQSLPTDLTDQSVEEIPAEIRTLACTLAAAWHLMEQPKLAESRAEPADRRVRRAYARQGRPEPSVHRVDLRTLYRPTDSDRQPETQPGRYAHRWVVSGHWRNQPHGPQRSQRKRIWIPDYVKGPDGAPLLIHERVNVWRR